MTEHDDPLDPLAASVAGDTGQLLVSEKSPLVWIETIDRGTGCAFVTWMVLLPLLVPIFCEPNTRETGDRTTGVVPLPLRPADVGDPYALCVTVSMPEAALKLDGEKTMLMEQVKPAARVLGDMGQLFVSLKFPVAVIELMVRAAFSPLRRVTDFVELFPKATFPKERGFGDRVIGLTPVPLKPMLCGLPEALSAMAIDPVMLPVPAGLKTTLIVQCAFGAKAAGVSGQLLLSEKGEGAVGGVILEITRGAVPVLVRRVDLTELVVPAA